MQQNNYISIFEKICSRLSLLSDKDFNQDLTTSIEEDFSLMIDEKKNHLSEYIVKIINNEIFPKFLVNSYDDKQCQIALGSIIEDAQLTKIIGKSNIICGGLPFPYESLSNNAQNDIKINLSSNTDLNQKDKLWHHFPKEIFWIPNIYIVIEKNPNNYDIKIKINISNKENLNTTKVNLEKLQHSLENDQIIDLINEKFKINFIQYNPPFEEYSKYFNELKIFLEKESANKVVLARDISCDTNINKISLLHQLLNKQKDGYCYFYEPYKDSVYSGITPEKLYMRNGKSITTEALAGTFSLKENIENNNNESEIMLNDQKNFAENCVVSNYIVNKLNEFCSDIDESPLEIIPSGKLFHMRKIINAQLAKNIKNPDELILKNLHPTPSMAGNPLTKALEFIKDHEKFERHWYSGTMGFISNDQAKFYVLIRGILLNQTKCHIFTGSGVILQSKLHEEWEELDNKMYNVSSSFL